MYVTFAEMNFDIYYWEFFVPFLAQTHQETF